MKETPNSSGLLSLILLSYYSKDRIERCYDRVRALLDAEKIPFEFIVMDDGSKDESYAMALDLEKRYGNVHAYQLSRNYTSHYSIFAGLSVCSGACAMPIVDDEQQPYQTIVEMYRLWEQGHKVIIPHRIRRDDPKVSKWFSQGFYAVMNHFSDVKYPPGGADLFFIDREVIDILNERIHPINTSSIAEVLRLGFDPYFYGYERPLGLNKTKSRWTFRKKLRLAKDTFFSSSTFPIMMINRIGMISCILSVAMLFFYVFISLFGDRIYWKLNVPGWTSIIVLIFFFGGLIMLSLGVIAEYIWRIYEEVKARPGYIIRKKENNKENSDE
ncbi:MAG: glycosyltransferase [Lentisphaeria bacterium]|nr:glycosyltransferase [Lentisphaeria bacterium]